MEKPSQKKEVWSYFGWKMIVLPHLESHPEHRVPLFNGSIVIPMCPCLGALFPHCYCTISYLGGCLDDINAYSSCQPSKWSWTEDGEGKRETTRRRQSEWLSAAAWRDLCEWTADNKEQKSSLYSLPPPLFCFCNLEVTMSWFPSSPKDKVIKFSTQYPHFCIHSHTFHLLGVRHY